MKKTFNVTDLTKKVLGTDDQYDPMFESTKKQIERHIKKMQKSLGMPKKRFEAPIEEMDLYVELMKKLLYNSDNEKLLNLLTKKLWKDKKLDDSKDIENLKMLIELFANLERKKMKSEKEREIFDKWIQDQLSDDYYERCEEDLKNITNLIKDNLSFFDNINNLESKLKILKEYMIELTLVSINYKIRVEEGLLFESCFLEVISKHDDIEKKMIYTHEDFYSLPSEIQDEILNLMEQKRREK